MKYWPVVGSKSNKIPINGIGGSFFEDRGDRYHCGVDIYAKEGDKVVAIENCEVIGTGIFTSSKLVKYWNKTYYIIVKVLPRSDYCMVSEEDDVVEKKVEIQLPLTAIYAELGELFVKEGDIIAAGEAIGAVGKVLNNDLIDDNSPKYIQKIKVKNNSEMLHFEMYQGDKTLIGNSNYLGGNWFKKDGTVKPPINLLDPTEYLENVN